MRAIAALLLALLMVAPAAAAPAPRFDDPRALLEAIYADYLAMEDWDTYDPDASIDEYGTFSSRLTALHKEADAIVMADGSEMGALDFSPFIYGQDSGGLTYDIGQPKIKGNRATATVVIVFENRPLHTIGFEFVDEGADGWKIDDIIMPNHDAGTNWRLSEYFADPLASL